MNKLRQHRGRILFLAGALAALTAGWRGFPVALYERVAQPVDFSHRIHADKAGAKCSGCHAQAMGTSAEERRFIERYVTPNREIPWQVYSRQPENVYFSHVFHIKLAHLDCRQCHGAQGESDTLAPALVNRISGYSGSPDFQNMNACEECHRQRSAANSCLACHK